MPDDLLYNAVARYANAYWMAGGSIAYFLLLAPLGPKIR